MNTDKKQRIRFICVHLISSVAIFSFFTLTGCGSPSAANIELRKQNQTLRDQIGDLNRRHVADRASIEGLKSNATTVPSLSEDHLAQLFTTHGLKLGKITGGRDLDLNKPGDEAIQVAVVPTDDQDQPLKAAGSFEIEAFDLQAADDTHVGKWTFDIDQARKSWLGEAFEYQYVLSCPLQTPPKHADLTIRVTFIDALTGRKFSQQRQIKINLP